MFAKVLNRLFLDTAPVVAHRNRIIYLKKRLHEETERMAQQGKVARIFNLGCGPAQEIQNFLVDDPLCDNADFLLLDFNDETITNTSRELEALRTRHRRRTGIKLEKRSVHQILKESTRTGAGCPSTWWLNSTPRGGRICSSVPVDGRKFLRGFSA